MILVLFILIGAALAVGPWAAGDHLQLDMTTRVILSAVGVAILVVSSVITLVMRLYRKASANMAFVRTGMGGVRVIRDGGTLVVPVVHQVTPVSLETMRLNVERRGTHA